MMVLIVFFLMSGVMCKVFDLIILKVLLGVGYLCMVVRFFVLEIE